MKISVIVCAYNEQENIRQCVDSVLAQKDVEPDEYEIIIVDDMSTDATSEICEMLVAQREGKLPFVHYIQVEHRGLSVARNTGLLRARAHAIAYIDADAVAEGHWISEILKAWAMYPDADAIGGRIEIRNRDSVTARFLHEIHYDPRDGHEIVGANMSFRKEKLLSVGAFGDPFVSRGDDTFVLLKMGDDRREKKWPSAVVFHDRPESIVKWFHERTLNGRMLVFIGSLFEQDNKAWKTMAQKRILLLLLATGCLFNLYLFAIGLLAAVLFVVAKAFKKGAYVVFSHSHARWTAIGMAIGWAFLSEIGLLCFSYGVLTPRIRQRQRDDSAWQGTVSDQGILKERTTG